MTGEDVPNPVSKRLEAAALPDLNRIKNMIYKAAKKQF
jgi:pyruvate/2-oxoglutarate/acetoin dehydrogenase E1 component